MLSSYLHRELKTLLISASVFGAGASNPNRQEDRHEDLAVSSFPRHQLPRTCVRTSSHDEPLLRRPAGAAGDPTGFVPGHGHDSPRP